MVPLLYIVMGALTFLVAGTYAYRDIVNDGYRSSGNILDVFIATAVGIVAGVYWPVVIALLLLGGIIGLCSAGVDRIKERYE